MTLRIPSVARAGVALLAALLAATALAQGGQVLAHDGLERSYRLHLPAGLEPDAPPRPLVLVLHGRGGDGASVRRRSGLDAAAERHGWIVAYPDALDGEWAYAAGLPGYTGPAQDDVGFLLALRDRLAATLPVDPARVYLVGYSNGGFLTQRLACERPGAFAAYASVAAAGFAGLPQLCGERAPLALLLLHGTEDRAVPWDGLAVRLPDGREAPFLIDVPRTFAFWAARAGCEPSSRTVPAPGAGGSRPVELRLVEACEAGGEIVLAAVVGGDHAWPTPPDLDVGTLLADFFGRHPAP